MKNVLNVLVDHALATLPDSISARKKLLRAILHTMTTSHPEHARVLRMLGFINKHEAEQAKLPLRSPMIRDDSGNGDGDGDGDGDGKAGSK